MEQYILAIDQGTTSTRAIIFDHESNICAVAQKELTMYYPEPGWVEQNAEEIWTSVVTVIFESLTKANIKMEQLAGIGITNQRETTVVWEKETGKPVYFALVWQSRQTSKLCDEMKDRGVEKLVQEKTGLVIDSYFSASKIRWILDKIDNGQERAENGELLFGTIDSWLVYKLSGQKVHITDVSNASRTLLMNIHDCSWDKELCALWNIPELMLPEIQDTAKIYGVTDSSVFGKEIPLASVVGDQQAALFGQACFDPGSVKNTYGTGCFLLMNTGKEMQFSKHGLLTSVGWRINGEINYVLEGSVFVAGAAIQWLRDELKMIETASESEEYAYLVEDSGGVVVVPAFVGLGAPYWQQDVKGAIFGLTRGSSDAHIIRATLESLAYQTSDVLKAMQKDTGLAINKLKVDGGACRNDFLMQWQANVIQAEVIRPSIIETTALGAAYLAGLAVGFWKHHDEVKENWQQDCIFEPLKSEEEMASYLDNWEKAIQAVSKF